MNVFFVSEYFFPRVAGGEVWAWDLCRALASCGHTVTVFTTRIPGTKEREKKEGVEILRPVPSGKNILSRKISAKKLALVVEERITECRPDLIHTMAYALNVPISRIAQRHRIPCVTSVHSYFSKVWWRLSRIGLLMLLLERWTLRRDEATIMHVPSRYLQERIEKEVGKEIVVLNNWLPEQFPKPETFKRKTFVFVGSLESVKNPVACVSVAKEHGARLVVIGNGSLREQLVMLARKEGVELELRTDSFREKTLAALGGADLVLIPSVTESFSLVAIEATAQGTPISATDVGIIPELKQRWPTAVVEYPPTIIPKRLSKKVQTSIRKEFSKDKAVSRFIAEYQQLVEKRAKEPVKVRR